MAERSERRLIVPRVQNVHTVLDRATERPAPLVCRAQHVRRRPRHFRDKDGLSSSESRPDQRSGTCCLSRVVKRASHVCQKDRPPQVQRPPPVYRVTPSEHDKIVPTAESIEEDALVKDFGLHQKDLEAKAEVTLETRSIDNPSTITDSYMTTEVKIVKTRAAIKDSPQTVKICPQSQEDGLDLDISDEENKSMVPRNGAWSIRSMEPEVRDAHVEIGDVNQLKEENMVPLKEGRDDGATLPFHIRHAQGDEIADIKHNGQSDVTIPLKSENTASLVMEQVVDCKQLSMTTAINKGTTVIKKVLPDISASLLIVNSQDGVIEDHEARAEAEAKNPLNNEKLSPMEEEILVDASPSLHLGHAQGNDVDEVRPTIEADNLKPLEDDNGQLTNREVLVDASPSLVVARALGNDTDDAEQTIETDIMRPSVDDNRQLSNREVLVDASPSLFVERDHGNDSDQAGPPIEANTVKPLEDDNRQQTNREVFVDPSPSLHDGHAQGNDIDDFGPTIESDTVKPLEDENEQLSNREVLVDASPSIFVERAQGNDVGDVGPTIEADTVKPLEDDNRQLTNRELFVDRSPSLHDGHAQGNDIDKVGPTIEADTEDDSEKLTNREVLVGASPSLVVGRALGNDTDDAEQTIETYIVRPSEDEDGHLLNREVLVDASPSLHVGHAQGNDIDDTGPIIEADVVQPMESEKMELTNREVLVDPCPSLPVGCAQGSVLADEEKNRGETDIAMPFNGVQEAQVNKEILFDASSTLQTGRAHGNVAPNEENNGGESEIAMPLNDTEEIPVNKEILVDASSPLQVGRARGNEKKNGGQFENVMSMKRDVECEPSDKKTNAQCEIVNVLTEESEATVMMNVIEDPSSCLHNKNTDGLDIPKINPACEAKVANTATEEKYPAITDLGLCFTVEHADGFDVSNICPEVEAEVVNATMGERIRCDNPTRSADPIPSLHVDVADGRGTPTMNPEIGVEVADALIDENKTQLVKDVVVNPIPSVRVEDADICDNPNVDSEVGEEVTASTMKGNKYTMPKDVILVPDHCLHVEDGHSFDDPTINPEVDDEAVTSLFVENDTVLVKGVVVDPGPSLYVEDADDCDASNINAGIERKIAALLNGHTIDPDPSCLTGHDPLKVTTDVEHDIAHDVIKLSKIKPFSLDAHPIDDFAGTMAVHSAVILHPSDGTNASTENEEGGEVESTYKCSNPPLQQTDINPSPNVLCGSQDDVTFVVKSSALGRRDRRSSPFSVKKCTSKPTRCFQEEECAEHVFEMHATEIDSISVQRPTQVDSSQSNAFKGIDSHFESLADSDVSPGHALGIFDHTPSNLTTTTYSAYTGFYRAAFSVLSEVAVASLVALCRSNNAIAPRKSRVSDRQIDFPGFKPEEKVMDATEQACVNSSPPLFMDKEATTGAGQEDPLIREFDFIPRCETPPWTEDWGLPNPLEDPGW